MIKRSLTVLLAAAAAAAPATAAGQAPTPPPKAPLFYAVIGDTPYGDTQVAEFPKLVDDVNADPLVRTVVHLGDIKNGSSTCTTERFAALRALYDTFRDPFVYTPGDNEWTDCHRAAAGGYDPLERLDALRQVFFPRRGVTTGGRPLRVAAQPGEYRENTRFNAGGVPVAMVHLVGSNNDLQPWFGAAETPEQRDRRLAEVERRTAAALTWMDAAFAAAKPGVGVVIGMQADTFTGAPFGFEAVNQRLHDLAKAYDGPVLLLQGDTHTYQTDQPFADVPNLTRLVVEGETAGEWLRLRIDFRGDRRFSWTREAVPGVTGP